MKRLVSVFLAVLTLFLCLAPALTATASDAPLTDDGLPVVVVRGMDSDALTVDPGDGSSRNALEIDTMGIAQAVFRAAAAGIRNLSAAKAVESLIGSANELCKYIACDKNGLPLYSATIPTYPLAVSEYPELIEGGYSEANIVKAAIDLYGAERTYYFAYDWRENPLTVCDGIAEMIDRALLESGSEKVNLICASLGGIETVAYISKYGYEKLNKCIFVSSLFYGYYMASDLFTGAVGINSEALTAYLLDSTKDDGFASFIVKALKATGLINALSSFLNRYLDRYKDVINRDFVRNIFGYIPSFWALVLPEYYDAAVEYMFGDDSDSNADFIALTAQLNQMVVGRDALLEEAAANGVGIAVIAGYNTPSAPIYAHGTENGDGTLETARMSGGATVAHFGKTLGEDYTPADPSKMSPDGVIDASSCLFPDSTWFVKDSSHVGCKYGSEYSDFLFWLVDFDGQPTVCDNPAYPQFMRTDKAQNLFVLE